MSNNSKSIWYDYTW